MSEAEFRAFFEAADTSGDGNLSVGELTAVLTTKGYTPEQCESLFASSDFSGDKKLSMDEFLEVMGVVPPKDHTKAQFRMVFESFDKDGSGQITKKELSAEFKNMGRNLSEDEIARMTELLDEGGDGTISYDEFAAHVFGQ